MHGAVRANAQRGLGMPGPDGSFDDEQVSVPQVLKLEDGTYRMYHSGFNKDGAMHIDLATSDDGIEWTRQAEPVLFPGEGRRTWDRCSGVERPRVVQTEEGWIMVYRGGTHLGLAFSDDGIVWDKYAGAEPGDPIITADRIPEASSLWFFSLLHVDDTYRLYVEAITDPGNSSQMFLFDHEGSLRSSR